MSVSFTSVEIPRDRVALADFLCADEWPYHGRARLSPDDVAATEFASTDVSTWWIHDDDRVVGLARAFDLDDMPDGSPLFDLRIAARHRGRGLGSAATRWLTSELFSTYPELHRIEANTRHDNVAMQRVLERTGYVLEGRLRESWTAQNGERFDSLVYGVLRSDRESAPPRDFVD